MSSVLKAIGAATVGVYVLSTLAIGNRKTNAYFRAVPMAVACIPELVMRYVENHGPYSPHENIFRNRKKPADQTV